MLYKYDRALVDKFKKVFDPVIYSPVDKFYERYLLSNDNSQIQLPALSVWRTSHQVSPFDARTQLRVPNDRKLLDDPNYARQVFTMKVQLNYQLDVWAGSDIDRDDLMKELLYFITIHPNISIEYENFKYEFPVLMLQPPDDTTDISDFESTGDIYRVSIPLTIPDARLFFYQDVKTARFVKYSMYVDDDKVL